MVYTLGHFSGLGDYRAYMSGMFFRAYVLGSDVRNDLCDLVSGWRE